MHDIARDSCATSWHESHAKGTLFLSCTVHHYAADSDEADSDAADSDSDIMQQIVMN